MEKRPVRYCVISHTHWDREWYMPLEHMKIRLVSLFDNLLEILDTQPDYVFHMDAQTVVLEDYIAIKPKNREKIERYVREGRMLIGPWYVQNDFYLSSGEATVRNLLIGSEQAEEYGKCGRTGYCPDQFGNIAQLPQIFRQFGIKSCVFGRGRSRDPQPPQEFYWQSEDGSRVFCNYMTHWYNNAQRFSADLGRSHKMLDYIRKNMEKSSAGTHYLLMNGVDHLEAQDDLLPILEQLQKGLPEGDRVYQGELDVFMEELEAGLSQTPLAVDTGEMREGGKGNILAGTLSSRIYLKQENDRCQVLLERQLEPLYAALAAFGIQKYPAEYLRYLWRQLLQNLAHDSICGCSVDPVHRHMADRYACIAEGGEKMLALGMDTLQAYISREGMEAGDYLLTVLNPVQECRSPLLEVQLDILESEDRGGITLRDPQGNCPQFTVLGREREARGVISPINLPGVITVISYRVQLLAEKLEGMSFQTYLVSPCSKETVLPAPVAQAPAVLENAWLRAVVNGDGTVDLTEKESGKTYAGLLEAQDTADVGDSYIFQPEPGFPAASSKGGAASVRWLQRDALSHRVEVRVKMALPAGYDFALGRRRQEQVPCTLRFVLSLDQDSRALNVRLDFTNPAEDHRLRLRFPTGANTDFSFSGNPFDCTCRNRVTAHGGPEIFDQPFTEYVAVNGEAGGLALFGKGLHEYEHAMDGSLYLSVVRATEYITRDMTGETEESWRVPENQCKRALTAEIAVRPYTGTHIGAGVARQAAAFATPVLTGYQPYDPKQFSGGRPFVQGTDTPEIFYVPKAFPEKELQSCGKLFTLEGDALVLSAFKQAEKGELLLIRLYNGSAEPAMGVLRFHTAPAEIYAASLAEEKGESLTCEKGVLPLFLRPKEIKSLLIRL